jgi:hypothetical protein
MSAPRSTALGFTILLSAFLLFQVQPLLSKYILPWFGGSPGVWTTCMLFFQVVLFAGYAYAHVLTLLPHRMQSIIHSVLILAALIFLPISPAETWKPTGTEAPEWRILLLLASTVGLPYFVLSSTSPLVQVWHMRHTGGSNPWRLYALSNIGSLAALLTYPFLFEPALDATQQTWAWSAAFLLLALLLLMHAARDRKLSFALPAIPTDEEQAAEKPIRWYHRPLWLLLPALASVMLLASTSHVCQDVAVIPFLWVIPLSLYLISFIITFDHERWYVPWLWALPALIILPITATLPRLDDGIQLSQEWPALKFLTEHLPARIFDNLRPNYLYELAWSFAAMFFGVMLCHGELTRLKPSPKHLTQFYLIMSAGGALGGLSVSLLAPRMFDLYWEWPIALTATFAVAAVVMLRNCFEARFAGLLLLLALTPLLASGTWLIFRYAYIEDERLEKVRNFYGTISVEEGYDEGLEVPYRILNHGVIMHGMQNFGADYQAEPTSYYGRHTGIGQALEALKSKPDAKVGIVGMGTATATVYAQPGHTYRIYEINPDIVRLAHKHFTYLADMKKRGAILEEVVGDARLALEREEAQGFDVLLLDAFSGDSVPVHLLTSEALAIYKRHIKQDGMIIFNITNTYIRLKQVLEKVAEAHDLATGYVATNEDGDHYSTEYLLMSRNRDFLSKLDKSETDEDSYPHLDVPLWTDQRHNLFQVLVKD